MWVLVSGRQETTKWVEIEGISPGRDFAKHEDEDDDDDEEAGVFCLPFTDLTTPQLVCFLLYSPTKEIVGKLVYILRTLFPTTETLISL